ncbi:hypothetical protein Tco_1053425 [Tanacetum coccineum]
MFRCVISKMGVLYVRAWIQSKNSLVKHFEDMRLYRPSKEYLPVWFDPPRDVSMSCLTTKGMRNNGAMCARRFRESLRRVTDGAEAFLILTLFILCLDKVSTDHAKLVPLGKVCTAKETLEKNTAKGTKCKLEPLISLTDDLSLLSNMAALESCPKHNMIAYLEKTEGNVKFHEVIDFLRRSYIYHALTVSDQAKEIKLLKAKIIKLKKQAKPVIKHHKAYLKSVSLQQRFPRNNFSKKHRVHKESKGKHFSGKVTPLFDTMLVQPTQDEGASSERLSDEQPSPSPAPTSEVPYEPHNKPLLTSPALTKPTGENLGDHSSNDTSLLGNEDDMTLPNVYDLCISLCKQVSDQAKEIKLLKAQITKLKKQAKPVIKHFKAYLKTVSLQQRLPRKRSSKKHRMHKESVSKQGRKIAKGEFIQFKDDPPFDVYLK